MVLGNLFFAGKTQWFTVSRSLKSTLPRGDIRWHQMPIFSDPINGFSCGFLSFNQLIEQMRQSPINTRKHTIKWGYHIISDGFLHHQIIGTRRWWRWWHCWSCPSSYQASRCWQTIGRRGRIKNREMSKDVSAYPSIYNCINRCKDISLYIYIYTYYTIYLYI